MAIWWVIIILAVYVIALGPIITLVIIQQERIRRLQRDLYAEEHRLRQLRRKIEEMG